ncbi:hypothetical protein, partial [Serratia liquefaciens]|uniref:hypothetical protein n=1 Tax=Serratia liquefaciens TaxID=614 RepID=UPI00235F5C94
KKYVSTGFVRSAAIGRVGPRIVSRQGETAPDYASADATLLHAAAAEMATALTPASERVTAKAGGGFEGATALKIEEET